MTKSNESGYAMIWLTISLPVAIFAFYGFFYLKAWLAPQQMTLQICRSQLLDGLSGLGLQLQGFLSLNNQVLTLRESRNQAELELKIAIGTDDPVAISAAEAQLQMVINEQSALANQQSNSLRNLHHKLYQIQAETRTQLERAQQDWSTKTQDHFNFRGQTLTSPLGSIAVREIPSTDGGPPTYELAENFTKSQAVRVAWKNKLQPKKSGEHPWELNPLNQNSSCSASLKPTNPGFQAVLVADKSSLN